MRLSCPLIILLEVQDLAEILLSRRGSFSSYVTLACRYKNDKKRYDETARQWTHKYCSKPTYAAEPILLLSKFCCLLMDAGHKQADLGLHADMQWVDLSFPQAWRRVDEEERSLPWLQMLCNLFSTGRQKSEISCRGTFPMAYLLQIPIALD